MLDKYGTGQDPYCYPGTTVLQNLIGIQNQTLLDEAERELTAIADADISFSEPPYDLLYFRNLHRQLFSDLYSWAGEIRSIDISKGETRFCRQERIVAEADKLFRQLANQKYFVDLEKPELIPAIAGLYGDLNVVHPFREGNGRAQRLLFEHIIINCGYEVSWKPITREEWLQANISAYNCDYEEMTSVFEKCIGQPLEEMG